MRATIATLCLATTVVFCRPTVERFGVSHVDRALESSEYPSALEPNLVGTSPGAAKSGAGYFYDDVLEYRVWMNPRDGASDLADGQPYFAAFAVYERAAAFGKAHQGAEPPLVLVRQFHWIDEPERGKFVRMSGARITEWQPAWLKEKTKREPTSIDAFIANPPAFDEDVVPK